MSCRWLCKDVGPGPQSFAVAQWVLRHEEWKTGSWRVGTASGGRRGGSGGGLGHHLLHQTPRRGWRSRWTSRLTWEGTSTRKLTREGTSTRKLDGGGRGGRGGRAGLAGGGRGGRGGRAGSTVCNFYIIFATMYDRLTMETNSFFLITYVGLGRSWSQVHTKGCPMAS